MYKYHICQARDALLRVGKEFHADSMTIEPSTSTATDSPPVKRSAIDELLKRAPPSSSRTLRQEMDAYSLPPTVAEDSLSFWTKKAKAYPRLSRLALSILAIPATSAHTERSFSRLNYLVNDYRHSLAESTIKAMIISSMNEIPVFDEGVNVVEE